EQLYGPMLALSSVIDACWALLMHTHRPHRLAFFDGGPITEADREVWVRWMETVFMPANRQIYELVVTKAHLLVLGDDMPQCLLDFCAHVAGYEVVLKQWEQGDYSTLLSPIEYPTRALFEHVRTSFTALRMQQSELLALTPLFHDELIMLV